MKTQVGVGFTYHVDVTSVHKAIFAPWKPYRNLKVVLVNDPGRDPFDLPYDHGFRKVLYNQHHEGEEPTPCYQAGRDLAKRETLSNITMGRVTISVWYKHKTLRLETKEITHN